MQGAGAARSHVSFLRDPEMLDERRAAPQSRMTLSGPNSKRTIRTSQSCAGEETLSRNLGQVVGLVRSDATPKIVSDVGDAVYPPLPLSEPPPNPAAANWVKSATNSSTNPLVFVASTMSAGAGLMLLSSDTSAMLVPQCDSSKAYSLDMRKVWGWVGSTTAGRDRDTARATLGQGLAVSAFPRSVPV